MIKAIQQSEMEKGANIVAKDNTGRTALHEAALKRCEAVVLLLLEKGADFAAKDNNGLTVCACFINC
jgi:ankyrin repeat protein